MALTLTTEAEIIRLAGVGAPTSITSVSATVVSIGEGAEKEFISDTRRNWIDDFASINANTKGLISKAVASKAAKIIAQADNTGYSSTSVFETMLDLMTDDYNRIVETLNKLDYNSIRSV